MSAFLTTLNLSPLADGQNWRVGVDHPGENEFMYRSDVLGGTVVVAPGFITDMASVPRILRNELPVWNTYGPAAVIHDWLYWTQTCDRDVADSVLREACRALGVDEPIIMAIYLGVRIGGQAAWDNNAKLKASGYTRLAPLTDVPPYASPA